MTSIRQEGLLCAFLDYTQSGVTPGRQALFRKEMVEKIEALPQVQSAAVTTHVPLGGSSWTMGLDHGPTRSTPPCTSDSRLFHPTSAGHSTGPATRRRAMYGSTEGGYAGGIHNPTSGKGARHSTILDLDGRGIHL